MDVMWCVWDLRVLDGPRYVPLERPNKIVVEVGF